MNFFSYPLKNIMFNLHRSVTIGIFIFIISFILVIFSSYNATIADRMENTIINVLTGHINIRPEDNGETDLGSLSLSFDKLKYMDPQSVEEIDKKLKQSKTPLETVKRIRFGGILVSDTDKIFLMCIGIDPLCSAYKASFKLNKGRFLSPENKNEILLLQKNAEQLNVDVGDRITVIGQSQDGYMVELPLTVVGIGTIDLLSMMGAQIAFTDIETPRELLVLQRDQLTDMLIYVGDKGKARDTASYLEKLLGDSRLSISAFNGMGSIFMSFVKIIEILFYIFIAFLMFITIILTFNIIYQTSIERYKEIGILKSIGFSRIRIIVMLLSEILLITLISGLIGFFFSIGLIMILSKTGFNQFIPILVPITGYRIYPIMNLLQILQIAFIIVGFSIIGSIYPTLKATKMTPVKILRERK
jgi:putative ABC transport system permease protein